MPSEQEPALSYEQMVDMVSRQRAHDAAVVHAAQVAAVAQRRKAGAGIVLTGLLAELRATQQRLRERAGTPGELLAAYDWELDAMADRAQQRWADIDGEVSGE